MRELRQRSSRAGDATKIDPLLKQNEEQVQHHHENTSTTWYYVALMCGLFLLTLLIMKQQPQPAFVYPNVSIVGHGDAVLTLARYTMQHVGVCGPRYVREKQEFSGSDFLSDWDLFLEEGNLEEQEQIAQYLGLYSHCQGYPIRLDATWDYINYPDTVRHVYDLIQQHYRHPIETKVIIVMHERHLERLGLHAQDAPFKNTSVESFCYHHEGLTYTRRQESCTYLIGSWKQHFGCPNVYFAPCEYMRSNQTRFLHQWNEILGLEARSSSLEIQQLTTPLDFSYNSQGAILEGYYSNDTDAGLVSEGPKICTPHVIHRIQGNLYNDSKGRFGDVQNQTGVELQGQAESLLIDDRTLVESRSGYYHVFVMEENGRREERATMTIDFRRNTESYYNVNGTLHFRPWEITVLGAYWEESNRVMLHLVETPDPLHTELRG